MRGRPSFFIVAALMCTITSRVELHSQTKSDIPQRVQLEADYAVFQHRVQPPAAGSTDSMYVELFFAVPQSALSFQWDEGSRKFIGSGLMALTIKRATGELVVSKAWKIESHASDTTAISPTSSVLDELRLNLEPGSYRANLYYRSVEGAGRLDSISFPIVVTTPAKEALAWSSIELCSSIRQILPGERGNFMRGTLSLVPNPGGVYSKEVPVVYYYAELYNVFDHVPGTIFFIRCSVEDFRNNPVASIRVKEIRRKKTLDAGAEVGTVNILSLPTGVYYLRLDVLDSLKNVLATARKKFFVFNPSIIASGEHGLVSSGEVLASEFATMSETQLDEEFSEAKYIASRDDEQAFGRLQGAMPKRAFLAQFWSKHNPNPARSPGEFRSDYLNRVEYANTYFRYLSTPGWKTDRGRVLLQYGKPQDIERHPSSDEMKPYEIWIYEAAEEGERVQFIFGDINGYGDYRLLHSTARGEIKDEQWQRQLR